MSELAELPPLSPEEITSLSREENRRPIFDPHSRPFEPPFSPVELSQKEEIILELLTLLEKLIDQISELH